MSQLTVTKRTQRQPTSAVGFLVATPPDHLKEANCPDSLLCAFFVSFDPLWCIAPSVEAQNEPDEPQSPRRNEPDGKLGNFPNEPKGQIEPLRNEPDDTLGDLQSFLRHSARKLAAHVTLVSPNFGILRLANPPGMFRGGSVNLERSFRLHESARPPVPRGLKDDRSRLRPRDLSPSVAPAGRGAEELGADRAVVSEAPGSADRLARRPGDLAPRPRRAERRRRSGRGRALHRHDLPDRRPQPRGRPPGMGPRDRAEAQTGS